jgi:hypothetical protein
MPSMESSAPSVVETSDTGPSIFPSSSLIIISMLVAFALLLR